MEKMNFLNFDEITKSRKQNMCYAKKTRFFIGVYKKNKFRKKIIFYVL